MKYKKKGFTLVEVLFVVMVVGIIASIVLVSISGARARARDVSFKSAVSSYRTAAVSQCMSGYLSSSNPIIPHSSSVTFRVAEVSAGGAGSSACGPMGTGLFSIKLTTESAGNCIGAIVDSDGVDWNCPSNPLEDVLLDLLGL